MSDGSLKRGDFTGLATNYARYRPGYSGSVVDAFLGLCDRPIGQLDWVDVGAGTGIFTRTIADRGPRSIIGVEPNDDMRGEGSRDNGTLAINWRSGSGEQTGLPDGSADVISMASSFHWVDFETGVKEFHRVLRDGGRFIALWNPRLIEINPVLVEIEDQLQTIKPGMKRVSSGRSGLTDHLADDLWSSPYFDDVVYLEGRHTVKMTKEHYLGVWRSVNDIQSQLGAEGFETFMKFVEEKIENIGTIDVTYLTRAWAAVRS